MEGGQIVVLAVAAFVVFIIAATGLKIVRPWEKGLIERLGKYQRTVGQWSHHDHSVPGKNGQGRHARTGSGRSTAAGDHQGQRGR